MSRNPRPGPPATYTTYRVVLLVVFAGGLFALGLVMFPGLVAVVNLLGHTIENVLGFEWDPF